MTAPKPTTAVVHLELMSKQRLIQFARAARAEAARQAATAAYWEARARALADMVGAPAVSPDAEWERARELLAGIIPDPDAETHRRDLEDQVIDDYRESIRLHRRRRDLRAKTTAA